MIMSTIQLLLFFNLLLTAISYEINYDKSRGTISISGLETREVLPLSSCIAKLKTKRISINKWTNNKDKNRQPVTRPFYFQQENFLATTTTENPIQSINVNDNRDIPNVQILSNEQEPINEQLAPSEKINDVSIDSQQQEAKRSQDDPELLQALLEFLGLNDAKSFKRAAQRDKGSMIYVGKKDI